MSTRFLFEYREDYSASVDPCYYCGQPATCVDHVVPLSMLADLAVLDDKETTKALVDRHRVLSVAACSECNSLLGSKYFDTLTKRRAFVKERLEQRYRKVLATPDWTEDELRRLSARMRGYVQRELEQQRLIRRRLRWSEGRASADTNPAGDSVGTAVYAMRRRRRWR